MDWTHIHLTQRLCLQPVSLGSIEYTPLLLLGDNHVGHELHIYYFQFAFSKNLV